ncbi:methionine synthase [Clostridium sp.]|uniref:methionine synthase n=1 Tax=Clostridium sp. TaxID=1506 RepID=UPI0034647415
MNNFSFNIDKQEVLRYLGYRGQELSEELNEIIDEEIKDIEKIARIKGVYNKYSITLSHGNVILEEVDLTLQGKSIYSHLRECSKAYLMAVTLGADVDKKIAYYERFNLTRALILDACATTLVEEYCDYLEDIIKNEEEKLGNTITWRYSPGYGDLTIDIQGKFLRVLNGERTIGLTASRHNLLIPRKSVTAIIGISKGEIDKGKRGCETCIRKKDCNFRKVGVTCGG